MIDIARSIENNAENWYNAICQAYGLPPKTRELVKSQVWLLDNYMCNQRELKLRFDLYVRKLILPRVSKTPSTNIYSLLKENKLSAHERKILELHFIDGKKLREIENTLPCSYGTIQTIVTRFKKNYGLII